MKDVFWDVNLYCIYGSRVISYVKESPSQSPTFQAQLQLMSSVRTLGHHQRQKNGGFHLFEIQTNYNGWPYGCPDLHYYTDVGTYFGYPFSNQEG